MSDTKHTPEPRKIIRLCLCLRCGHDWYPRTAALPIRCPQCFSPYWNRPREKNPPHASLGTELAL